MMVHVRLGFRGQNDWNSERLTTGQQSSFYPCMISDFALGFGPEQKTLYHTSKMEPGKMKKETREEENNVFLLIFANNV